MKKRERKRKSEAAQLPAGLVKSVSQSVSVACFLVVPLLAGFFACTTGICVNVCVFELTLYSEPPLPSSSSSLRIYLTAGVWKPPPLSAGAQASEIANPVKLNSGTTSTIHSSRSEPSVGIGGRRGWLKFWQGKQLPAWRWLMSWKPSQKTCFTWL